MNKFITNFKTYKMLAGLVCAALLFGSMFSGLVLPSRVTAQTEQPDIFLYVLSGYYMEIIPGEPETLYLEIENAGTQGISGIDLLADLPENWTVEYTPISIPYLGAGQRIPLEAVVLAPENTSRGEYNLVFIAETAGTRTFGSTAVLVRDTSGLWQWVGLGLGLVMIGGFILFYRHFNRN
ncbi:NEW3 domain-containing protein [Dehalococcoides mccartyi]|uniref:NEW3 domain-containing protein n=1 Tax=Dehalococcoides mccartyi TaxID=61435 RepID=UPI00242E2396|nr:NEW3 domain-containing protein [Dehalococcoides mccartyi]